MEISDLRPRYDPPKNLSLTLSRTHKDLYWYVPYRTIVLKEGEERGFRPWSRPGARSFFHTQNKTVSSRPDRIENAVLRAL